MDCPRPAGSAAPRGDRPLHRTRPATGVHGIDCGKNVAVAHIEALLTRLSDRYRISRVGCAFCRTDRAIEFGLRKLAPATQAGRRRVAVARASRAATGVGL